MGACDIAFDRCAASPKVRNEIVKRLRMKKAKIYIGGFDRPNIRLRVDQFEAEATELDALLRHVHWAENPGIGYAGTGKWLRRSCILLPKKA